MELSSYVSAIASSGSALTAACRQDPTARVAACPDWDVAALTGHLAGVHAWAASIVRSGSTTRPDFPAAPTTDVADWADDCRTELLDALKSSSPTQDVWVFGDTGQASFWWRRQAHETNVHAWDGCSAVGHSLTLAPDVASDGVDELLTVFVPRMLKRSSGAWAPGKTVHAHCTDVAGEWLVTIAPDVEVRRAHEKGDVAVRGTAQDLLLWVHNRTVGPSIEILGDAELAAAWGDNIRF